MKQAILAILIAIGVGITTVEASNNSEGPGADSLGALACKQGGAYLKVAGAVAI